MPNPFQPGTPAYDDYEARMAGAGGASAAPPPYVDAGAQGAGAAPPPVPVAPVASGPEGGVPTSTSVIAPRPEVSAMPPAQRVMIAPEPISVAPQAAPQPLPGPRVIPGGPVVPGRMAVQGRTTSEEGGVLVPTAAKDALAQSAQMRQDANTLAGDAAMSEQSLIERRNQQAAKIEEEYVGKAAKKQTERDEKVADIEAKIAQYKELKPEELWTDVRRLQVAVGYLAAGIEKGYRIGDGKNELLSMVEDQIKGDIAARKGKLDASSEQLRQLHSSWDTEDKAMAAERLARLQSLDATLKDWSRSANTDKVRAKIEEVRADLQEKIAEQSISLAKTEQGRRTVTTTEHMTKPTGGGGRIDWSPTVNALYARGVDPKQMQAEVAALAAASGISRDAAFAVYAQNQGVRPQAAGLTEDQQKQAMSYGERLDRNRVPELRDMATRLREMAASGKPGERIEGFGVGSRVSAAVGSLPVVGAVTGATPFLSDTAKRNRQNFMGVNDLWGRVQSGGAITASGADGGEVRRFERILGGEDLTPEGLKAGADFLERQAAARERGSAAGVSPAVRSYVDRQTSVPITPTITTRKPGQ